MNYSAGLLAFLLFYVPLYFVYKDFKKKDREIEQRYKDATEKTMGNK